MITKCAGGAPGCPNKYNPYHVCVQFCYDQWREGTGESRLPRSYLRRRTRMLRRHPLPAGWAEVYDAGVRRHYYWNTQTDDVCWLSPTHPRAVIGESAPRIAAQTFDRLQRAAIESVYTQHDRDVRNLEKGRGISKLVRRQPPSTARRDNDQSTDTDDDEPVAETKKQVIKRVRKQANVDPMDPASYGECTV